MPNFNERQNRFRVSEELMKHDLKELGFILIRLVTYMETGNHPDRQTFWEYLDKINIEKRHGQMFLDQQLTEPQNETVVGMVNKVLDKAYPPR